VAKFEFLLKVWINKTEIEQLRAENKILRAEKERAEMESQ